VQKWWRFDMRLNWNNIGKGLEGIAAAKQARDLAQESARYDVTEGAYGPGLQENIQQLEGLKAQDPAQAAAYDQAIAELTRRQGLTAADYSVASGPTNYATRQEARQAAAPMRAEGLAGVYRRYGDVDKADTLEARAYEQQRALAKEARDVEAFGLTKTKAQQDIDTGALTLEQRRREADAAKNMDTFNKAFGEANAKAQAEGRVLTPNDIAKLAKDAKLSYSQENELIASQVNRTKAEVDQFRLEVEKTVQGKGFEALVDLHKNDKRFGDGVHFVPEIDPKTGGVTMARVNEATGKVEERLKFKTKAEATAYLREEAANPANAAIWLQNYRKGEAAINASNAAANKDNAAAGLYASGGKGANKPSSTDALVKTAEDLVAKGTYKDLPTAIEALKKGAARDADKESWLKTEQELMKSMATPEEINQQRTAFFVRRGYAPPAARAAVESGINPTTGKPLTKADVDAYNATYPQTPVDPSSLPWLPSPEREARRQGLINQIPK
jgi:hypothetical protein